MDSNIGSGGTDVLVPEEQLGNIDVNQVEFQGGTATQVAIAAPVSEITHKVEAGVNHVVSGKKMSDSKITLKKAEDGSKSSSILRLDNAVTEDTVIKAQKGVSVAKNIASGKFRRSSFKAGKRKKQRQCCYR